MSGKTTSGTAPTTAPGKPPPLSVRKRIGFSLVLLGLTGVLVVVLGEASFRAWAAYDQQRAFADADYADDIWAAHDPLLGYRLNPAFEDHNAAGLRDRPLPPRSQTRRLLMLGDSVGYYGDSVSDGACVAQLPDGSVVAFGRRCPHEGADLAFGRVRDGEVVCPWHDLRFDARSGKSACQTLKPLRLFDVEIEDDVVTVRTQ